MAIKYTLVGASIISFGLCIYFSRPSESSEPKTFLAIFSFLLSLCVFILSALYSNKAEDIYVKRQISEGTTIKKCGYFLGMSNGVNTSRGGETKNGFSSFIIRGELERFNMQYAKVSQSVLDDLSKGEDVCVTYVEPPLMNRKILVEAKK